ncbi:TIR domain-containing protein (plasmid) [Natrinema zhouii]|uniref:TIR domain-containing protein n=1 Tax=Natrinema zhouii TaxID=1710539 RepID=UPI001CFFCA1E|nr:TIR domain-containing protein [Natrinema zhouii]UHQ99290.1 TIR domain-containing protein [Natrinema zhouii]
MTPNENDPVTNVPTVEVQSPTGSLDVNALVKSNGEDDPFAGLFEDTTDGSNTTSVPTADQQNSDVVDPGKDFLAGYADWKGGQVDHDPHDDSLRYLWHDAPELIIAAIVAGYFTYKGAQGLGGLVSSGSTTDETGTSTRPRLPLEDRPYRVFVSHSWKYSEQRERIEKFLDDENQLNWQNFSVPEDDPMEFEDTNDLRQQLYQQVGQTNVVVVVAGMYVSHSEWIEEEIEIADHFEKPIIGVRPNGNERLPAVVTEAADEIVGWRQQSIVDAIAKHG